ncbi:hypothetical protein F5141DRAFT_1214578 [Pisolithus sp. B1]|nr:hypothetical protein F5141DRAFT_1214578 [Pisolithus sp. B1]
MQRVQAGQVDPGYHFPKPTLFVNVSMPEQKKTYLFNWLSAHLLWISQVSVRSPSKFPSPQMWRDFLNTIGMDQPSSMRSASMKSAVWDILGENIIHAAQGFTGASEEIEWGGMQDPITAPSSSSQLPDGVPPSPSSPSDDGLSLPISVPPLPSSSSALTNQLPYEQALLSGPSHLARPLLVPPPPTAHYCHPLGTKALYLPAPPPVFVLPGQQCLAQDAGAMLHHPQPPTCKLDVFDVMNDIQLNEEVNSSSLGSSQKQHNQWWQWSEDIIPALVKPYMEYLELSQSLHVIVDAQVDSRS